MTYATRESIAYLKPNSQLTTHNSNPTARRHEMTTEEALQAAEERASRGTSMSISIYDGAAGSPARYRATAGDSHAWIDSDGTVFLELPYRGDGCALFTVRGGSVPDLTIFADAIHDDITALVDGLRATWETNREERMREELARLKAELGVTE